LKRLFKQREKERKREREREREREKERAIKKGGKETRQLTYFTYAHSILAKGLKLEELHYCIYDDTT